MTATRCAGDFDMRSIHFAHTGRTTRDLGNTFLVIRSPPIEYGLQQLLFRSERRLHATLADARSPSHRAYRYASGALLSNQGLHYVQDRIAIYRRRPTHRHFL